MLRLYEIEELERKWSEYNKRQKSIKKPLFILIFFSIIVLFVSVYFYFEYDKSARASLKNASNYLKATMNEKKVQYEKEKILKKQKNNIDLESAKDLSAEFLKENSTSHVDKELGLPELVLNNIDIDRNKFISNKKNIITNNMPKEIKLSKEEMVNTNSINNLDKEIKYLIDKFSETKSIHFATKISELYYEVSDFSNSRKWALIANKIDPENEKSWELFAKSSYKLGLELQAREALQSYLKTRKSSNIKNLLNSMSKGAL